MQTLTTKFDRTNQKLWDINNKLTTSMTLNWVDGLMTVAKASAEHMQNLSRSQAPAELAAANWQLGLRVASEVGAVNQSRMRLVGDAVRDSGLAVAGAFNEPVSEHIADAVVATVDQVEEVGNRLQADFAGVIEADLERINGIGPAFAEELNLNGVHSVSHVAVLNLEEIAVESHPLNSMLGHIENGEWVEQARALIAQGEVVKHA